MARAESLSPDNSGADQYVPPVPDAGGNRPSGPGSGHPGSLPSSVRQSLPGGSEGRLLARLATDPGSGAPSVGGVSGSSSAGGTSGGNGSAGGASGGSGSGGSDGSRGGSGGGGGDSAGEANASAASAITGSVSDNPGVGVLVAAMVALALAAAAFGRTQRRRGRRS